jgi:hypothetical protein
MMRSILVALIVLLFSGCAKYVETDISVFHELKPPLSGISYTIVPSKEQAVSLEFKSYAAQVKSELNKHGMVENTYGKAKYAIYLSYGMDGGKSVVSFSPVYGETGIGSSFSTGTIASRGNSTTFTGMTFNTPMYGVIGSESRTDIVFIGYLNMDILDIAKSAAGEPYKVYEARGVSYADIGLLAPIMPAMIRSLFEDFPGQSGSTRRSRQPLEKQE